MKLIISFMAATLAVCSQAQTPTLMFQWHGRDVEAMKTTTLIIAAALAADAARAQTAPDWSRTFLRRGTACGLLSEREAKS
jgi:hypothetical protein